MRVGGLEKLAVDGGLNTLRRWRIAPDRVIGDLDSTTMPALSWASKHDARIHPRPSQESSDVEKGLELCKRMNWRRVLIVAAEGDRIDHVVNTLAVSAASRGLEITLVTRRALVFLLRGKAERVIDVPDRHTISWFGFPEAKGCSLSGVVWPLRARTLRLGGTSSLSNLCRKGEVRLTQTAGVSLLTLSLKPKPAKSLLFSR